MSDQHITLTLSKIHIKRRNREIGPGVSYNVESGGVDLDIGGSIMSTSLDHEERVHQLVEDVEESVELDRYDHNDELLRVTYESPADQSPELEWLIEEPRGWRRLE